MTVSGRRFRSRPRNGVPVAEPGEVAAEWQRLCPQATLTRETRFQPTGTGD